MLTRERGASMIELLITIAIVAVLVGAGLPSFAEWMQNSKIRTTAESIQNGLQIARTEAVKRNSTIVFRATDANKADWEVCLWDVAANDCAAGVDLVQSFVSSDGGSDVKLGGTKDKDAAITTLTTPLTGGIAAGRVGFTGFGRMADIDNDLKRIDITNPKLAVADQRRLVIQISTGGQIKMCDPKLDVANNPRGC